jgi:hypothetical protein
MAKFLGQIIRANILASDFFLWGYMKSRGFQIYSAELHNLKLRISEEIDARSPVMPSSRETLQAMSISVSI